MNALAKLTLVLATILPTATVLAGSDRHHGDRDRGRPAVVVTERVYTPAVVRVEREVVHETRCIGTDRCKICVTKPVVQYREVIEQPCVTTVYRTVAAERPYSHRGAVVVRGIKRFGDRDYDHRDKHCDRDKNKNRDRDCDRGCDKKDHKHKDKDTKRLKIKIKF